MNAIIGIDCATKAKKVGLALGFSSADGVVVERVKVGGKGSDDPLRIATRWAAEYDGSVLFALDAPLGWPVALANELSRHQAGAELHSSPNSLFHRATDDFIHARLGKKPLEVGADRIARTAHAALKLLGARRRDLDSDIPLVWAPDFTGTGAIEVYPAATLKAHDVEKKGKSPRQLVEKLEGRVQLPEVPERWQDNQDAVDALICVLAGHDFLMQQAMRPDPAHAEKARREGWIWARKPVGCIG
ncbi:DUF429 domain-containing protein [soil metagenome]